MSPARVGFAGTALLALAAAAQPRRPPPPQAANGEAATVRRLSALRSDPLRLRTFLHEMPKGGDLHSHLSGAVYAESYLRWAADDRLCLSTAALTIVECNGMPGQISAADVLQNPAVYNQAVDAMSMRHWNTSLNGHDHFFAAFARFGPVSSKTGEMLAEVTARAGSERVSYLELMLTPDTTPATLGRSVGWDADLSRLRARLLAAGLRDAVIMRARQRLDAAESRQRELLRCGEPAADPGCAVTVRYIAQVGRAAPKEVVFAQLLAWFELAGAEPRVVSLNLVQPEDDPTAIRDFNLHMSMLDFLHRLYPRVPITLHAGELADGLVPPEALRSHVRQSVETGHAARIGHATSIMHEDRPFDLLHALAARGVLVEVALTSSEQILDMTARKHPLPFLLEHHVPVALVTDDMGVSRSTHTDEFVKAVEQYGLDYLALKGMVRNSIDYAFADPVTKRRLKLDVDQALAAFERQSAGSRLKGSGQPPEK